MALADTAHLVASFDAKDNFTPTARKVEGSLKRVESTAFKVGQNIGTGLSKAAGNLKKLAVIGGGLLVTALAFAVQKASDLNESMSKTQVVFGKSAAAVIAFSKTAAASLGLTQQEALEAGASFGNMFKTIGLAQPKAAAMSTAMVKLASDMASFNNEDPNEMLDKLRSGLAGEAEPLRRFGVLLSEAAVKAEAHAMGLDHTVKNGKQVKKTLTEADKVLARYSLILKQTGVQQGDFSRTSGGLANQMRILRANVTDAAAKIGTALLPAVAKIAQQINKLITENQPAIQAFADQLPGAFEKLQHFVLNLPWDAIKATFVVMGTGARALLDAFLAMPPWVQTAVLTGWGLNKLTGGMLTNIFGTLAQGLIKGVLGMNAGVVNIKAGVVNGAGGPGGAGGKGLSLLGVGAAAAIGLAIAAEWKATFQDPKLKEQTDAIDKSVDEQAKGNRSLGELLQSQAALQKGIQDLTIVDKNGNPVPILDDIFGVLYGGQKDDLKNQLTIINAAIEAARKRIPPGPGISGPHDPSGRRGSEAGMEWRRGLTGDRLARAETATIAAGVKQGIGPDIESVRGALGPLSTSGDIEALRGTIATGLSALRPTGGGDRGAGSQGDMESRRGAIGDALTAAEIGKSVKQGVGPDIEDVRGALITTGADTVAGLESARGTISTGLTNTESAARTAGNVAANASYGSARGIENTIRANRPIINVDVNISATTIEKTVTVTDRNGPSGGSATDDLRDYPH